MCLSDTFGIKLVTKLKIVTFLFNIDDLYLIVTSCQNIFEIGSFPDLA